MKKLKDFLGVVQDYAYLLGWAIVWLITNTITLVPQIIGGLVGLVLGYFRNRQVEDKDLRRWAIFVYWAYWTQKFGMCIDWIALFPILDAWNGEKLGTTWKNRWTYFEEGITILII